MGYLKWLFYKSLTTQSNLRTTTTLITPKEWLLMKGGLCSEVSVFYKRSTWDLKMVAGGNYSEVAVCSRLTIHFVFSGELSAGQTRRRNYEEPEIGGATAGSGRMENSVASCAKQQLRVELNTSSLQVSI